jgi:hypothetical protein
MHRIAAKNAHPCPLTVLFVENVKNPFAKLFRRPQRGFSILVVVNLSDGYVSHVRSCSTIACGF